MVRATHDTVVMTPPPRSGLRFCNSVILYLALRAPNLKTHGILLSLLLKVTLLWKLNQSSPGCLGRSWLILNSTYSVELVPIPEAKDP